MLEVVTGLVKQGLDPRLVIFGEGIERPALERIITKHGLQQRVLLAGYQEGARNYIPLFDLFVMPSLTEGLPITLLEVMQANVPVVASAVGGIPEVLDGGKAGLLVKPECKEDLQNAIIKVAGDKQLAYKIKERARKRAGTEYSCSAMAMNYKIIYNRVLGR